jgi:Zn-dependent protease with chaperone function
MLMALLAAGAGGWVAARISLGRSRRYRALPWPERARVAFAARHAMAGAAWALAFFCGAMAFAFDGPFSAVPVRVLTIAAGTCGFAVALGWCRFVAQRLRDAPLPLRQAVRSSASAGLMLASPLLPLLLAMLVMPTELDATAALIVALAAVAVLALVGGGAVAIGRAVGLIRPAAVPLREIVDGVARQLRVPVRGVYEIDWHAANAFALPLHGWLVFTTGALALLSPEEIAAVSAHEVGHLTESRAVTVARVLRCLLPLPLVLLVPLIASGDWFGLAYVLVPLLVVCHLYARFSRRLEARADTFSHTCAGEGIYARALERVHRANLLPVVFGKAMSHPDLYDRMQAAGVTPDYPRPRPPSRIVGTAAFAAALMLAGVMGVATPLLLHRLAEVPAGETARLHASLLVHRGQPGTLARLADLRAEDGDGPAAATLYRTAARLSQSRWSAAAYRAAALAVGDHCHDARRLLAVARDGYERRYGDADFSLPLVLARSAVQHCAVRARAVVIGSGARAL